MALNTDWKRPFADIGGRIHTSKQSKTRMCLKSLIVCLFKQPNLLLLFSNSESSDSNASGSARLISFGNIHSPFLIALVSEPSTNPKISSFLLLMCALTTSKNSWTLFHFSGLFLNDFLVDNTSMTPSMLLTTRFQSLLRMLLLNFLEVYEPRLFCLNVGVNAFMNASQSGSIKNLKLGKQFDTIALLVHIDHGQVLL